MKYIVILTTCFLVSLAEASTQTSLSYDYLGRVIQVTEQGQTEDYFYSGEKRVFKKEASGKKRLYLFEDHSVIFDREVEFGKRGDADGTGTWTITDAVYLINYIFAGGPSPKPNLLAGDADGNSIITIGDAVWLISFIFAGGPSPSSATLSLSGAANVFAPGAGRLWSDGAMGNEDLYFVEDSVSSTSAVLAGNALGEVIHSTPFGEQLTTSNLEKRYLFTGKEMDATTGLFYYGARYYDPALGRFLQWDSVMDGANRYLYVRNNPINANDPSGHEGGGNFWSNIGMPSPVNLVATTFDNIANGLSDLWNTIDRYTSVSGWTEGVRALQGTGFNPAPGQVWGQLAFSLIPASGLDIALTAIDIADGPVPEITAARRMVTVYRGALVDGEGLMHLIAGKPIIPHTFSSAGEWQSAVQAQLDAGWTLRQLAENRKVGMHSDQGLNAYHLATSWSTSGDVARGFYAKHLLGRGNQQAVLLKTTVDLNNPRIVDLRAFFDGVVGGEEEVIPFLPIDNYEILKVSSGDFLSSEMNLHLGGSEIHPEWRK